MRRVNQQSKQLLLQQMKKHFGGHPAHYQKVEYNPDNLKVHQGDITPDEVEHFRADLHENRAQLRTRSKGAVYLDQLLSSGLVRNDYFVGFMKNVVAKQSINEIKNSNYFNPPKLHDNSVFLCQSEGLANRRIFLRSLDGVALGTLLLGSVSPFFHLSWVGLVYMLITRATVYHPTSSLVVRMDLLPHLEQVSVMKIGFNGNLYNQLHNISALEKVEFNDLKAKSNVLARAVNRSYDSEMVFRDKETGDYLLFDRLTMWNKEGISHPLISDRK